MALLRQDSIQYVCGSLTFSFHPSHIRNSIYVVSDIVGQLVFYYWLSALVVIIESLWCACYCD